MPARPRSHALFLTLLMALGACSAAQQPGASADPGSSDASAAADATRAPLPDELSAEDEALVAALRDEGYTESEAVFIALTEVEVEPLDEYSSRITYLLPSGNDAEITVTVVPDQVGDVGPDALTLTTSQVDGGFAFDMEYFVPYEAMPADVREDLEGGTATHVTRLALVGLIPLGGAIAGGGNGVNVIVKALVDKLQSDKASELIKLMDKRLGPAGVGDTLFKLLKSALSVADALAMQSLFEGFQRQIDELEECARNPTNPITRRAYRDDPGYLQRILEQIGQVREEVKENTAVMFIAKLNATAAGLLSKKVPWLSFVTGPLTSWSKATLEELNAKLIEDLAKNITKCGEDYRIDKTVTGTAGSGFVTYAMHYTGVKCGGPAGEWTIDSAGTWTGGGDTAEIGGPITVQIDENSLSGPLRGTVNFRDVDADETTTSQVTFTGTGRFDEQGQRLVLDVTGSDGLFGVLDTGVEQPGTLTFPLEVGAFCDEAP